MGRELTDDYSPFRRRCPVLANVPRTETVPVHIEITRIEALAACPSDELGRSFSVKGRIVLNLIHIFVPPTDRRSAQAPCALVNIYVDRNEEGLILWRQGVEPAPVHVLTVDHRSTATAIRVVTHEAAARRFSRSLISRTGVHSFLDSARALPQRNLMEDLKGVEKTTAGYSLDWRPERLPERRFRCRSSRHRRPRTVSPRGSLVVPYRASSVQVGMARRPYGGRSRDVKGSDPCSCLVSGRSRP